MTKDVIRRKSNWIENSPERILRRRVSESNIGPFADSYRLPMIYAKAQRNALLTEQQSDTEVLTVSPQSGRTPIAVADADQLPALIAAAGHAAQFAWEEFIYGQIRNPHTRRAYGHAVRQFLTHCRRSGLDLTQIAPRDIGLYLDGLQYAAGTKKLHLAALRHFFDTLVTRHVVVLNPAASVRGDRLQVMEGKTPEIGVEQARRLLRNIDASHVVGLRDRAIIGILIYTAARVGAVARLRRGDFYSVTDQHCLRFTEKGGKSRGIPVRHDLKGFILDYLAAGGLDFAEKSTPLFRSAVRRTKRITQIGMTAGDIGRMVKRLAARNGFSDRLSPHSFRVTTITDLLSQGVSLADVQNLAGHADPRTTRLYDRRQRQVTRNIVERISI